MKIRFPLVASLLFLNLSSALALQPSIEADRQFLAAQRAIKESNFKDAIEAFDAVLATGTKNLPPDFNYFYGHALLMGGDYQRATGSLTAYLNKGGRKAKYYQQALLDLNEVEAAKKKISEEMEIQNLKEAELEKINKAWKNQVTIWSNAPAEDNDVCGSLRDRIKGQSKSARNIKCDCDVKTLSHPAYGTWQEDRCKVTWQGNPLLDGVRDYDVSKSLPNPNIAGRIQSWSYKTYEE